MTVRARKRPEFRKGQIKENRFRTPRYRSTGKASFEEKS